MPSIQSARNLASTLITFVCRYQLAPNLFTTSSWGRALSSSSDGTVILSTSLRLTLQRSPKQPLAIWWRQAKKSAFSRERSEPFWWMAVTVRSTMCSWNSLTIYGQSRTVTHTTALVRPFSTDSAGKWMMSLEMKQSNSRTRPTNCMTVSRRRQQRKK